MIPRDAAWVPSQIRWTPQGPLVDWCHLGDLRFTGPFFEQTIGTAMSHPFNLLLGHSTPLDALDTAAADFDQRPAGLIFHMSRCGSTALAQMLAALPRNVVLSEPGPLDQILRMPSRLRDLPPDLVVRRLRAMTAALGRRRHPEERDLFIKLEGWHVLLLPLIRRAFSDVPWVFLYREPVAVMASLARHRSGQTMPGGIDPAVLGLAPPIQARSLDHYAALVLARFCAAAIEHYDAGGGMLIEYRELAQGIPQRLLDHFGLSYPAADIARMREAAGFDAKRPGRPYADDSETKRNSASDDMRDLAATLVAPLHARLEALRRASAREGA